MCIHPFTFKFKKKAAHNRIKRTVYYSKYTNNAGHIFFEGQAVAIVVLCCTVWIEEVTGYKGGDMSPKGALGERLGYDNEV